MTYLTIKQRLGENFDVIFEMVLESNRTVWILGYPEQVLYLSGMCCLYLLIGNIIVI